jgi:hypothetical protein
VKLGAISTGIDTELATKQPSCALATNRKDRVMTTESITATDVRLRNAVANDIVVRLRVERTTPTSHKTPLRRWR